MKFHICLLLVCFLPVAGWAQPYSVNWFKVAGGGGTSTGDVYIVSGTFGQAHAGGPMQGGGFSFNGGFWSYLSMQRASLSGTAPTITSQPHGIFITNGAGASLSAQLSGTSPIFYQWQKNGVNLIDGGTISGSTSPSLQFSGISQNDAGNYTLIAVSAFGSVTSSVATVLSQNVIITGQPNPASTNITIGNNISYSVSATGLPPLRYQWQRGCSPPYTIISNATNATFAISSAQLSDSDCYSVVVSNSVNVITSSVATLVVKLPNDDFANRTDLGYFDPFVTNTFSGTTLGATSEPNEPYIYYSCGDSVWFTWTAPNLGPEVSLTGANLLLLSGRGAGSFGIFTGSTLANLNSVYLNSPGIVGFSFPISAGTTYQIRVDEDSYDCNYAGGFTIGLSYGTGPGGGVVDLDPGAQGFSTFVGLSSVSIIGPTNMYSSDSRAYGVLAQYQSISGTYYITNYSTVWRTVAPSIISNGVFTAQSVTTNTPVTISADYFYSGLIHTTNITVIISNLPPPKLTVASLNPALKNFAFTLSGVAGRTNLIQMATNLAPPVAWSNVATNVFDTNGPLNFTNSTTNFQRLFYRAKQF